MPTNLKAVYEMATRVDREPSAEEKNNEATASIAQAELAAKRNKWLEEEITKLLVSNLYSLSVILAQRMIDKSESEEAFKLEGRRLGIEAKTINKVLNLIATGKYE